MIKNNAGFTIIEVLTAVGLMGIITYGVVSGTALLFSTEAKSGNLSDEAKIIQSFVENISSDPAIYQKNFTPSGTDSTVLLAEENLPWGYANGYLGPRKPCDEKKIICHGYVGYVIRPMSMAPGLYEVTFRLLKVTDDPMKPDIRDYVFITSSY